MPGTILRGRCRLGPRFGTMEIADLLTTRTVIPQLRVTGKKQALQEIARRAAVITGCGERQIYEVLAERERLGSTGICPGVAVPHGKLSELNRLFGVFARLDRPIPFEAVDVPPADLVFVVPAPPHPRNAHPTALATVSRPPR